MPLRWRDLDMLGHLNQAVYHELMEDARGGLMSEVVGMTVHLAWVLVHVELDYHHEVRLEHSPVEVVASIENVGTKSVTLRHELLRADGTVAASGRAILVAWDGDQRTSRELSERERETLRAAA